MPGTNAVAWSTGAEFGTFIPETDSSRTLYRGSGEVQVLALRPDGTAAVVRPIAGGAAVIVDLATGVATPVPLVNVIQPRGVLLR